jgi:SagB-type dehydrogenase family enzyme
MKKNIKKINLSRILGKPTTLYEEFHQKTKLKKSDSMPNSKDWPEEWSKVLFKEYPRMDKIVLPNPQRIKFPTLDKALLTRTSLRKFSKKPISLEQLSTLLFYSARPKNIAPPYLKSRLYPSGGSRYPLEVYMISLNTELPHGIYHYNLRSHSLETLYLSKKIKINDYFLDEWVKDSPCLIVISAVFSRISIKYGDRGYRLVHLEAGHLGQNFYLNCVALNLSCCGLSGFVDDKINKLLDIDGISESVVYTLAVGQKK